MRVESFTISIDTYITELAQRQEHFFYFLIPLISQYLSRHGGKVKELIIKGNSWLSRTLSTRRFYNRERLRGWCKPRATGTFDPDPSTFRNPADSQRTSNNEGGSHLLVR